MEPGDLAALRQGGEVASQMMSDAAVARRWADTSALGGFTVGGLAAHLYAAMRRFETALDEPLAPRSTIVELAEFYGLNRVESRSDLTGGLHPLIQEDAERRAAHGPDAVARRFRDVMSRLDERLPREPAERLIPVWTIAAGATTLRAYVATRVVELIVHSDDLAASVDLVPPPVPREAASVVIGAFVEMARHRSGDLDVIRSFARRERAGADVLRVL